MEYECTDDCAFWLSFTSRLQRASNSQGVSYQTLMGHWEHVAHHVRRTDINQEVGEQLSLEDLQVDQISTGA